MFPHPRAAAPAARGLTRSETIWTIALTAAIVLVIVGTVRAELVRARARLAQDTLDYLAAHVYLALEEARDAGEDPRAWSFPLLGPGAPPDGLRPADGAALDAVLPDAVHVPPDPWGRAYVLVRAGTGDGARPALLCAGADGDLPDPLAAGNSDVRRLHWPPRPRD